MFYQYDVQKQNNSYSIISVTTMISTMMRESPFSATRVAQTTALIVKWLCLRDAPRPLASLSPLRSPLAPRRLQFFLLLSSLCLLAAVGDCRLVRLKQTKREQEKAKVTWSEC